uniref:Calcineurin-like phosphoesterase domain-containing protein n=1 Tax=viral metagenome TaxID=1070528 RepID=A0A6C0CRQ9_9ZZZZ
MHPIHILEQNGNHYNKIIHFSDIHIRTGDPEKARYREYSAVFQNLINILSNKDLSSTLIVITGDLFHHKGKIETSGIKLANQLFQHLLNLAPTFVICGNHDYRQDDPDIPDMIEALLELHHKKLSSQKYPLYYLNKTGIYLYNNLSFSVVDIRDALKSYNTFGRNEELISFPSCENIEAEYKIAMFHGYVAPKDLCERYKNMNIYQLEWFGNEYPYILLGDIHRQQIHNTPYGHWAYPGSLIQQDFGERPLDHGYLEWDLKNQKVDFHRVYNPYGFCTIKKHMGEWYVHSHQKEWYELDTISKNEMFPKTPMVRILNHDEQECKEVLTRYGIQPQRIQRWMMEVDNFKEDETLSSQETVATYLEELNTPDKWMDYLNHLTQKDYSLYIRQPENLKLPQVCDFLKKYHERNEKVQKVIDEYMAHQIGPVHYADRVELVNMSWHYLMCYGENNYFDFTKIKDQIALLNGKNAMGKSSFLDILCIGLYGTPTKMRSMVTAKKYTDKIIHDHRPSHKVAPSVTILLKIKDICYEIHRVFGSQSGKDKEHMIMQKEISISKIHSNLTSKEVICEGNTTVEAWIEKHIGSMDSVLMSTMICQMDLNNFFHMKQEDQKTILDTALHLENVALYGKILRESLLAHQDLMNQIKTAMDTVTSMATAMKEEDMLKIQQAYKEAKKRYEKHHEVKEYWLTKVKTKNWQNASIPEDIEQQYRQAKDQYDFEFNEEVYQTLTSRLETSIRLEEKLKATQEALKPYEDTVLYKDSERHLTRWEKKKQQFLEQKPKSDVSLEWITGTREKYDQWKQSHGDIDPISLQELLNTVIEEEKQNEVYLKTLYDHMIMKPHFVRPVKQLKISFSEEAYYKCMQKFQEILENENKPSNTLIEYEKWMEKYEEWYEKNKEFMAWKDDTNLQKRLHTTLDKIQQWNARQQELQDTQKEVQGIEKDLDFYKDLEFNPNCSACKKNPFHLKKQDLEHNQKELVSYCKKIQVYLSKLMEKKSFDDLEYQKEDYEKQLEAYKQYKLEKNYYKMEYQKWTNIKEALDTYDEWKVEYNKLMKDKQYYDELKLHHDWNQYDKWKTQLTQAQQKQNDIREEKQQNQELLKEYHKWQEILINLVKQEDQNHLLQQWFEEEKVIENKLHQYQQSIKKQKLMQANDQYECEYQSVKEKLKELKRLTELKNNFQFIESLYASYKLQLQENSCKEAKENLERTYQIYIETKQTYDLQKEYQIKLKQYLDISNQLDQRYNAIKELEIHFIGDKNSTDGYKEWIYKNKVIPLVNQEMNHFLSLFEDFRFKMIYDKKQFIYMLEDRGNQPTLDKASGYQNFIIGIAFRITFSRIGAIGQQFKHLMIDEGFTACDNINIEKVPILLKSIMEYGKYHSIILMSHLDSVRDCSHKMIQIERQDPFSYIRYGNPYPIVETTMTPQGKVLNRGRGRPKTSLPI